FHDHYLDVPFDLSEVMFICTANVTDTIPRPLLDRCEMIELRSYTDDEKVEIARRYLVKRQLDEAGLDENQVRISEEAIRAIIRHYTREAGCRNLEREIAALVRHAATRIAEDRSLKVEIGPEDLQAILGAP